MKTFAAVLMIAATATISFAQEELPREQTVKFAAILNYDLDKLADTPIPTDADIKRPVGIKGGEKRGAIIVPESKLTAAVIEAAGEKPVSVGQLWLSSLVPAKDGQAAAKEKLKTVTVQAENNEHTVVLCVLGVRKAGDKPELVVYGKDKEPLLTAPLKKVEHDQTWPIEFKAEREGEGARLTLWLAQKYEASFLVNAATE